MDQSLPSPQPPQHLSEFYSFVNPGLASPALNSVSRSEEEPRSRQNSDSHTPREPFRPSHGRSDSTTSTPSRAWGLGNVFRKSSMASLNTMGSTVASTSFANIADNHPDLPAIITQREVADMTANYQAMLSAAAKYREAMTTMSRAAAEFGAALDACSRSKGTGASSDGLQAAGGLHYLVANHHQILAKSIHTAFEAPVRRQVDKYARDSAISEMEFRTQLRQKTKHLKQREAETQRMAHRRMRNLAEYRHSLLELTSLIDDIDTLKYSHLQSSYNHAENTASDVLNSAASVVRAELEIYEGLARKGWSGGGLEDLVSACPDPFTMEDEDAKASTLSATSTVRKGSTNADIFSVLPSNSILPPMRKGDEVETLRAKDSYANVAEAADSDNGSDSSVLQASTVGVMNGHAGHGQSGTSNTDDDDDDDEDDEDGEHNDSFYTEPVSHSNPVTPSTPQVHTKRSFSEDIIGYSGWNTTDDSIAQSTPNRESIASPVQTVSSS